MLWFTPLIKAGSDQTTCTSPSLTGPVSASSVMMTPARCGRYNVFLGQLLWWEAFWLPAVVSETDFVMLYELCSVCPFCDYLDHHKSVFSKQCTHRKWDWVTELKICFHFISLLTKFTIIDISAMKLSFVQSKEKLCIIKLKKKWSYTVQFKSLRLGFFLAL